MAAQTDTSGRSALLQEALATVDLTRRAVEAYHRPDLDDRLQAARRKLTDPAVHVLIVGEFKQGKSSLVNALLNAPLCPVDDDIATAVPTLVGWSEQPRAAVIFESAGPTDQRPPRVQMTIDEAKTWATERNDLGDGRKVQAVEIGIPRKLLATGLVLVDTPGVGGLGSAHGAITLGALPMADAVVFVSDASQEYSAAEIDFLHKAAGLCPNILCVLTKTDFYPAWRKVRELDMGHLQRAGFTTELLPVSSTLRVEAIASDDRQMNAESGFAELVSYLQERILAQKEHLHIRAAVGDVLTVSEQLHAQFAAERAVLEAPEQAGRLVDQLENAKSRADQLRSAAAKWQQVLGDGIADLIQDVEHDLRARIRKIARDADEAIEAGDPAEMWTDFEPWLYKRVADDVVNNYRFLFERSAELSNRVAEHFELDSRQVQLQLAIADPSSLTDGAAVDLGLELDTMGVRQQGMQVLRGSYMGTLMFTMIGNMAGIALGPAAVVIGMFMGRKSLRDEKERQLNIRRNQARNSHRKYTDEVVFTVGKDSRDTLRRVQRQLRDHYAGVAEELLRSATETLAKAQQAAQSDQSTRERRLRDAKAELERIEALQARARKLGQSVTAPGAAAGALGKA
jgi:hypothetical protein